MSQNLPRIDLVRKETGNACVHFAFFDGNILALPAMRRGHEDQTR
jgi:hypothetical protein